MFVLFMFLFFALFIPWSWSLSFHWFFFSRSRVTPFMFLFFLFFLLFLLFFLFLFWSASFWRTFNFMSSPFVRIFSFYFWFYFCCDLIDSLKSVGISPCSIRSSSYLDFCFIKTKTDSLFWRLKCSVFVLNFF